MTGSLQIKSDKYYAVLNFQDKDSKRVQKWLPLNLTVKGNKRRAEVMLNELLVEYGGLEAIEPMRIHSFRSILPPGLKWTGHTSPSPHTISMSISSTIILRHILILGRSRSARLLPVI